MKLIVTIIVILFNLNFSAAQWIKINVIPTRDIVALTAYGDTILAATGANVLYKSIDGGTNWDSTIVSNNPVIIITLKVIDDTIYVGTNSHGVFYSADHGHNWLHKGSNLLSVTGIEKKGNNLYVSTLGNGVYVYSQNINNWIPFNNSLPSYSVNVNCLLSTSNSLFNAAGANGTFYRYDFNTNAWNEEYYYGHLSPGLQIQKFINNSDTLFAVNWSRIIRSDNNGLSWVNDKVGSHNGISRIIYSGITQHYTITNVLNGGTWIQHRIKFSVAGASWANDEEFFPNGYSYDILEFQNKLFLARADGLYVKGLLSGVDDLVDDTGSVNIYPNPSTASAINISSNGKVSTVAIITALGTIAYFEKVDKNEFTIQPDLAPGLYFLSLSLSNGKTVTRKIIIE